MYIRGLRTSAVPRTLVAQMPPVERFRAGFSLDALPREADVSDVQWTGEGTMPLQKWLQAAGVGAKHAVRQLIAEGQVRVDGVVVTRFAEPVTGRERIEVAGDVVADRALPCVLLMHKPKKHITGLVDPEGRPTLGGYLPADAPRVFAVGRLDFNTEGALLWTNDGALARRVLDPAVGLPKVYRVKVRGHLEPDDPGLDRIRSGLTWRNVTYRPAAACIDIYRSRATWVEIILTEGQFHEVRRMCHANGWQIVKLRREKIGPIELGDLNARVVRALTPAEREALYASVSLPLPDAFDPCGA